MARSIAIDTSGLEKGINRLISEVGKFSHKGLGAIADEILRLSQFEVPHDTGALQNSGHVEEGKDQFIVGYNKVYAARLHENPQYRFQKGRKGKYLEDPIKNNTPTFIKVYGDIIKGGVFA